MSKESQFRQLTTPESNISPYDQAVIDFRKALADNTVDMNSTLEIFHVCQSLAPHSFNIGLGRRSIGAYALWQLRALTFEGETAALRRGDQATATMYSGARFSYEDLLVQYDPEEMPQITSLPNFQRYQELRGRRIFGTPLRK